MSITVNHIEGEFMRCFIEIDVPDNIKEYIFERITQIKNASIGYDFRVVKKENLHVTLAFLGEIDEKNAR